MFGSIVHLIWVLSTTVKFRKKYNDLRLRYFEHTRWFTARIRKRGIWEWLVFADIIQNEKITANNNFIYLSISVEFRGIFAVAPIFSAGGNRHLSQLDNVTFTFQGKTSPFFLRHIARRYLLKHFNNVNKHLLTSLH